MAIKNVFKSQNRITVVQVSEIDQGAIVDVVQDKFLRTWIF